MDSSHAIASHGAHANRLHSKGYCVLSSVLAEQAVQDAIESCAAIFRVNGEDPSLLKGEDGVVCGARNLLRLWPEVIGLARHDSLRGLLHELLGPDAGVVRVLYFDKPPGKGWALPWHKDLNIAVRAHGSIGRFRKPTTKAGVPHVEAPEDLLREMVAVRIHLDDMLDDNGPLQVIPGSHRSSEATVGVIHSPVILHCRAGDALLMRPLLTHASSNCTPACKRHRRVVHIECAPTPELSDGYRWCDYVRLF